MRRIKLLLEYEGTRYSGWQLQTNHVSIQGVLEDKLHKITKKKTRVIGSGRTDAGVHAEGQVAHFQTSSSMKLIEISEGPEQPASARYRGEKGRGGETRFSCADIRHPQNLPVHHSEPGLPLSPARPDGALHRHSGLECDGHAKGRPVSGGTKGFQILSELRLYR